MESMSFDRLCFWLVAAVSARSARARFLTLGLEPRDLVEEGRGREAEEALDLEEAIRELSCVVKASVLLEGRVLVEMCF